MPKLLAGSLANHIRFPFVCTPDPDLKVCTSTKCSRYVYRMRYIHNVKMYIYIYIIYVYMQYQIHVYLKMARVLVQSGDMCCPVTVYASVSGLKAIFLTLSISRSQDLTVYYHMTQLIPRGGLILKFTWKLRANVEIYEPCEMFLLPTSHQKSGHRKGECASESSAVCWAG